MQYLPIYPEKKWDQTVLGYDYWGPAGESLPVTNTFLDASRNFSQLARISNNPVEWLQDVGYGLGNLGGAVLVGPVVDTVGNIGNTAYNGYKRVYNYGANAYNNLADKYNNWAMQRRVRKPQQLEASLQTIPVSATPEEAQQVVIENNAALGREQEARIIEAKKLVANELRRMSAAGELTKNISKVQKLIDLYNKIK